MEFEIKSEAELEEAAVRIGHLKGAISGSLDAVELKAIMQAMVLYVKRIANKPDKSLPKEPGPNKKCRLLGFPKPWRKGYPTDWLHLERIAAA